MRYRVLIAILGLMVAMPVMAQVSPHPFRGSITTAGADCSTATSCVVVTLPNDTASATISIDTATGSFSGTLNCEQSVDGGAWIASTPTANSTSSSCTALSSGGSWQINPASYIRLRVRASVRASGTAAITINWGTATASNGGNGVNAVVTNPSATQTIQPTADVPAAELKCFNGTNSANIVNFRNKTGSVIFSVDCSGNLNVAGSVSTGTAPTTLGNATGGMAATCSTAGTSAAVAGQGYIRCDTTTGFWVMRHVNGANEVALGTAYTLVSSGAIGSLSVTNGPSQIITCTATCSLTPLTPPAAGYQLCVVMAAGVTGTITLNALGNSAMYGKTDGSAYGTAGTGTAVSTSTTGNRICVVGRDATHYETPAFQGTFTMN